MIALSSGERRLLASDGTKMIVKWLNRKATWVLTEFLLAKMAAAHRYPHNHQCKMKQVVALGVQSRCSIIEFCEDLLSKVSSAFLARLRPRPGQPWPGSASAPSDRAWMRPGVNQVAQRLKNVISSRPRLIRQHLGLPDRAVTKAGGVSAGNPHLMEPWVMLYSLHGCYIALTLL